MLRDWDGGGREPRAGLQTRAAQRRAAAGQKEHLARRIADSFAKRAAAMAPPERAKRAVDPYLEALAGLPLYQMGNSQPLSVAPAYRHLVRTIATAAGEGGRHAVLFWPATDISLSAGAVLTSVADCLAAPAITIERHGESFTARSKPLGLRTLLYPAASTAHRPLKDVYVDKTVIERCHTQHQVRSISQPGEAGFADYHQALSRVKTLTGRGRDGQIYEEFRHPNLDEWSRPSMRWTFGVELERPSVRRPAVEG